MIMYNTDLTLEDVKLIEILFKEKAHIHIDGTVLTWLMSCDVRVSADGISDGRYETLLTIPSSTVRGLYNRGLLFRFKVLRSQTVWSLRKGRLGAFPVLKDLAVEYAVGVS